MPLMERGITDKEIRKALPRLRKQYGYYIEPAPGRQFWYFCAEWPFVVKDKQWEPDGSFKIVDVICSDPRLNASNSKPKTKFPVPRRETAVWEVMNYLLRHRSAGTHWCDVTYLYDKYGSKFIQRKIRILNRSYGFHIRKPISGLKDNLWIVDRERNVRKKPKVDHEYVEVSPEDWQEKFGGTDT